MRNRVVVVLAVVGGLAAVGGALLLDVREDRDPATPLSAQAKATSSRASAVAPHPTVSRRPRAPEARSSEQMDVVVREALANLQYVHFSPSGAWGTVRDPVNRIAHKAAVGRGILGLPVKAVDAERVVLELDGGGEFVVPRAPPEPPREVVRPYDARADRLPVVYAPSVDPGATEALRTRMRAEQEALHQTRVRGEGRRRAHGRHGKSDGR